MSKLARILPTLLWFSACDKPEEAPTYHRDVAVVVERYCGGCHQAGGIGAPVLGGYDAVRAHGAALRSAVAGRRMPPWMPDGAGVPLRYSRALPEAHRELLLRWVDAGMPEGDPAAPPRADVAGPEQAPAPRADLVLDPGAAYQPDGSRSDDYHCFAVGPAFSEDAYFAAGDIRPDQRALVHHVIVYEIGAKDVPALDARNADGKGYTCFGGPGVGRLPQTLLVWAPGTVATRAPQGTAMRVSKGSRLVMQVHYNLAAYRGQGDRTTVVLERSAGVPEKVVTLLPVADPGKLKIPPHADDAAQTITIPMSLVLGYLKLPSLSVVANFPHMHVRGTSIRTSVNEQTLLSIPRWDFSWQQLYQFQEPFELRGSDALVVECRFRNEGPTEVRWGENTTDEMCLSYLQAVVDRGLQLPFNTLAR